MIFQGHSRILKKIYAQNILHFRRQGDEGIPYQRDGKFHSYQSYRQESFFRRFCCDFILNSHELVGGLRGAILTLSIHFL